jgi:esterase/lipase superfamily enzyme
MELLWFGRSGRPVVLFPTSGGRFTELEDTGFVGSLGGKIARGEIQVCCVDSVDTESWYNRSAPPAVRVRRHDQYDQYLRDELFPYVRARSGRGDLALFGASFGAYHAMNVACRYPEQVGRVIAFSGIFDIHRQLNGYWDDLCYFHCPTAYVPNLDEGWVRRLSQVQFVVATGEFDHLAEGNREFIGILAGKGIPLVGEIWQGSFGHDWPFWKEHIQRFLP